MPDRDTERQGTAQELVAPGYALRPHWAVLWAAYAGWLVTHRPAAARPAIALVHAYLATSVAVMALNGYLGSYGYRSLFSGAFLALTDNGRLLSHAKDALKRARPDGLKLTPSKGRCRITGATVGFLPRRDART